MRVTTFEEMDLHQVVRDMIASTGKSAAEISREMGKSRAYLSVMLHDKTKPSANLLAFIADACGYELVLRGHGREYVAGYDRDNPDSGPFFRVTVGEEYEPGPDAVAIDVEDDGNVTRVYLD